MKTPEQTDVFPPVYVSNPVGANRVLPLRHIASTASTNTDCLKALGQSSDEAWHAVWTDDQTAGRGRQGRTWFSKPGHSLCLTVGRRLPPGARVSPALPVAVGAALVSSLRGAGCAAQLKWPNDILFSGAKLGGILCEAGSQGAGSGSSLVVGVGINLKPVMVQGNLAGSLPVTSLQQAGLSVQASELALRLAQCTADILALADQPAALSGWCQQANELDAWQGRQVCVIEQGSVIQAGLALGIAADGHYRLSTSSGEVRLGVGELSLRESA